MQPIIQEFPDGTIKVDLSVPGKVFTMFFDKDGKGTGTLINSAPQKITGKSGCSGCGGEPLPQTPEEIESLLRDV